MLVVGVITDRFLKKKTHSLPIMLRDDDGQTGVEFFPCTFSATCEVMSAPSEIGCAFSNNGGVNPSRSTRRDATSESRSIERIVARSQLTSLPQLATLVLLPSLGHILLTRLFLELIVERENQNQRNGERNVFPPSSR